MSRTAFMAILSHWRYRPLQLATLLVGIALATALWSGVQAINAEARASYDRAAAVLEQNRFDQLLSRDGKPIDPGVYGRLRRAGWIVSPVIEGEHRFGTNRIRLVGIDPLSMPTEAGPVPISSASDLVAFVGGPGLLVVSPRTAERLGRLDGLKVRISADIPDDAAFVDIAVADRLLGADGRLTRLVLGKEQTPGLPALGAVAPELVLHRADGTPDVARLTDSFHLNLTAFGFLAFVVGLFIVYSATGLSFEQRRGSFRTLRSLGVSLPALTVMLVGELMLIALSAGIVGVVIGYVIASALMPGVAATLRGLYGASVPGALSLRPEWWAAGIAIALMGTAVSSAQSLRLVWTMPILAAGQSRSWARASGRGMQLQGLAGLVLLVATAALALFAHGLIAGFAVLGGLLLGAALLLPILLSAALGLAENASGGTLARWFWADTRLQLPGLSLALIALLLALSANIGVGTMVSSFRQTFVGWLDQRLAAELYVTARDEMEAARLRAWLPGRTDAVLPIWNVEGEVLGETLQIYGVADHPTYRDHWPLLSGTSNVWDRLASGEGALVNEQLWRGRHVQPGQTIRLPGGWEVAVAGVYSDYGNPRGQVIVGLDALTKHYPEVAKLRYGLRVSPEKVPDLKRFLVREFGLPEANIIDQAALKRQSQAVFEQTFSVTAALNVLTLAVAGFAMFSSLLTLSGIRLPQLAPVWAMGVRRRDLALMELARTLALWLATFVLALPVGLTLAWVLLSIVNVEAFGWKLPIAFFPMDWLRLGVVALVAALVSVFLPVRRLARVSPADLLRIFANER